MASPTALSAVELVGGPPAGHRQVVGGGAQVLADGDDVDADAARGRRASATSSSAVSPMPAMSEDLVVSPAALARARTASDAGVARRGPHGPLQPGDGLDVVVQHVGPLGEDHARAPSGSPLQSGISTSTDTPGVRARMARITAANSAAPPSARSSRATAVTHGEPQAHPLDRLGHPLGLLRVGGLGVAGVDQAEAARPGAALAVDHEGGGAVGPALGEVGAARLLAHGDEVEVAHRLADGDDVVGEAGPSPASTRACGC